MHTVISKSNHCTQKSHKIFNIRYIVEVGIIRFRCDVQCNGGKQKKKENMRRIRSIWIRTNKIPYIFNHNKFGIFMSLNYLLHCSKAMVCRIGMLLIAIRYWCFHCRFLVSHLRLSIDFIHYAHKRIHPNRTASPSGYSRLCSIRVRSSLVFVYSSCS